MSFSKTILVLTLQGLLFISPLVVSNHASSTEDCVLTEEIECYYCDSHHNEHCGNPFKFSHFYVSTEVYMIACYGCCIKMVYPLENGERRIIRSCVENHPHLNITGEDDCNGKEENSRQVCVCSENQCNGADQISISVNNFVSIIFLTIMLRSLC